MRKLLCFLLVLFTFTSKAQKSYTFFPLTNGTEEQVKFQMAQCGGTLQKEILIKKKDQTQKELTYTVSDSTKRKYPYNTGLDVFKAIIYFRKFSFSDKIVCSEYSLWYSTEKFLPGLIAQLDNRRGGFKRVGKSLKWIKMDAIPQIGNREMNIIKIYNGKEKGFIFNVKRF